MKRAIAVIAVFLALAGCTGLFGGPTRQGVSSSLVDYLYPKGEPPPPQTGVIPHLQLPLKVGLAFVPSGLRGDLALPESERIRMLNDVRARFAGRDFISEITVIPDAYLRSGRGFDSLEQTARLYGLDVMALVSYDQVTHSDERTSAFLYWTIVGAYTVHGNRNDVQTFVDTAVFDVPTRKLLFRAPGVSQAKSTSTLVGLERDLRQTQREGFEQAMADMTANLDQELSAFKERIRTEGTVRVTRAESSGGGGAAGGGSLLLLGCLALAASRRRRATA
ncbi:MAG: rhombotarget lipoprotein [Steroidobacteraceae bacterium]|nr:rhombotarget lipoprotein [Steroidobacteraceae bacterium]